MDIRTVSRFVGAACLVVGPAAVTIGTLTAPVGDGDPPATALAKVTAHPGAQRFTIAVGLFAILLVPAMVYLTRMARRGAPWLATIGGGLAFLGWLAALMSLAALDVVNYHAAQLTDRG